MLRLGWGTGKTCNTGVGKEVSTLGLGLILSLLNPSSFVPCSEKIHAAVTEMASLFPKVGESGRAASAERGVWVGKSPSQPRKRPQNERTPLPGAFPGRNTSQRMLQSLRGFPCEEKLQRRLQFREKTSKKWHGGTL